MHSHPSNHFVPQRLLQASLVLAAALTAAHAQAPLDVRVALVIGNAAYPGDAALANPGNDAKAMGDTLRGLGFDVVELRDGERSQMVQAIDKVRASLKGKAGIGMMYYAGHGLQLDWRNYMVPVDARLSAATDVPAQAVDVGAVVDAFKVAGNRMNIVVLDACRDNPFAVAGSGKGLAQVDAPPGTILAYATAPGNVAADGSEGNGLYTQFLLQELVKPQARIEDVFKRTRFAVRKASEGRQIPWESTSLEDDFMFNAGKLVAVPKPDDRALGRAFAEEKAEWDRIKDSRNSDDFYAFLARHPNGLITEQAALRLERLQVAQTINVPNQDGVVAAPAGRRRFELGDETVVDLIDGFSKARRRVVRRVTRIDEDRVEVNGGAVIWDQSGSILKNQAGTHSPGILLAPADLAVGKKWSTYYQTVRPDSRVETASWTFRATGYETVTVPAGTFKAIAVEGSGSAHRADGTTSLQSRHWFDAATGRRVKYETLFRSGSRIVSYETVEAVSFKRGKPP